MLSTVIFQTFKAPFSGAAGMGVTGRSRKDK